jgi:hypothetical protein
VTRPEPPASPRPFLEWSNSSIERVRSALTRLDTTQFSRLFGFHSLVISQPFDLLCVSIKIIEGFDRGVGGIAVSARFLKVREELDPQFDVIGLIDEKIFQSAMMIVFEISALFHFYRQNLILPA